MPTATITRTVHRPGRAERVNVFVAASSPEEARRLSQQIEAIPGMRVTGTACDRKRLEKAVTEPRPVLQILVTDAVLGDEDATPVIEHAKHVHAGLEVLVYTSHSEDATVMRAILAGAMGYLLKGDQEDIAASIRLLRGGGSPVSPVVARSVLRALHSRALSSEAEKKRPEAEAVDLSKRETEILGLLAKGISFAEIGSILSISPHTVTAHIKKIYRKLQVHSRGEAVYEATCLGILPDRIG